MFRGLKRKSCAIPVHRLESATEALSTAHGSNVERLQQDDNKGASQPKRKPKAPKAASVHALFDQYGTIQVPKKVGAKVYASIENQEYFHGILPRDVVDSLIAQKGDFLVRKYYTSAEAHFVLSVLWESPMHILILQTPSGLFYLEGPKFQNIPQLINHYFHTKESLLKSAKVLLFKPIRREEWQLRDDDIVLGRRLGEVGESFEAFAGTYRNPERPSDPPMSVAIKKCNRAILEAEDCMFIYEASRVRRYIHPNIVRFIGACVQRHPVMIVMELTSGGVLSDYLRKDKSDYMSSVEILAEKARFCKDAATGMDYLARQGCLHRNLAARNCLLGENKVVKIDVFGKSREGSEYRVPRDEPMPIKWTAFDVLVHLVYTTKADVWAYGILMWEIYADGADPYPNMNTIDAIVFLKGGGRMEPPIGMPRLLAMVMLKCWSKNQEERPDFSSIEHKIQRYIQSAQSISSHSDLQI